jgi:hypothetical protein
MRPGKKTFTSGDDWSASRRPDRTTGDGAERGSWQAQIASAQGHWPEFGDRSGCKTVLEADASVLSVWIGA